jgi:hypothetical protein
MFNNVNLISYLGSDAESRTTRNNFDADGSFTATKRTWKNREAGDRESRTTWHRCVGLARPPNTRLHSPRAPTSRSSARSRRGTSSAETARRNM